MTQRRAILVLLAAAAGLLCTTPASAGAPNVAVFNFQMKAGPPEWKWLEKGLADRIITDLFREKSVSVVQRDEMQRLARQMQWCPEMMNNPKHLETIRRHLRPDYLISGVYEVRKERMTLTAVVVDFNKKKEITRRQVTGSPDEVNRLMRQLSAELLSWLTNRPTEKVLEMLPVWTRSTPAAKALYEGINLYDQGRYAEAWIKFRRASRTDPAYIEAQYWVGRMYYFMDRYRHARHSYEAFMYMAPKHPRVADAIKEYLHTHEKLNTPPDKLLELYDCLARRHPDVRVHNVLIASWVRNDLWLQAKSARILDQTGRHRQATELASDVVGKLSGAKENTCAGDGRAQSCIFVLGLGAAQKHNLLTGKALLPDALNSHYLPKALRFKPGQKVATSNWGWPFRCLPRKMKNGKTYWRPYYAWWLVAAPDEYVFKRLTFHPIVKSYGTRDVFIGCHLHKDSYGDVAGSAGAKNLRDAVKNGAVFDNLPRSGIFHVHFYLGTGKPYENPGAFVRGIRAVAELEKLGPHGAVEVACTNAVDFTVHVDGRQGRKGPGLIGLLPPGEHTLELRPYHPRSPFAKFTRKVTIREGKTTNLEVQMPFKPGAVWSNWTTALIGRDYPPGGTNIETAASAPSIQADKKAIRVVWTHSNDLWTSMSTDGRRFSRPRRLPMPVSSGWIETSPVLLRDESGRFVLLFQSDRNGRYRQHTYVCWSRDFVHWSAPAMILDRPLAFFDVIQDDRGRFIIAENSRGRVTILTSRDAYRWEKAGEISMSGYSREARIIQHDDGTYGLFAACTRYKVDPAGGSRARFDPDLAETYLYYSTSTDLKRWSPLEKITGYYGPENPSLSPMNVKGRTLLGCIRHQHNCGWAFVQLFRRCDDGTWSASDKHVELTHEFGAMAWHRRWGYMIAWNRPGTNTQFPTHFLGPFFLRGGGLQKLIKTKTPQTAKGATSAK